MQSEKTETKKTKYFLGVDWGKKRCGLAIADDEVRIASSFGECEESSFVERVREINREYPLKAVIFGFSEIIKNEDCHEQMSSVAERLRVDGFDVLMEEEIFSTLLAQKNLLEAEKINSSKEDNAESARIILQGWIDKKLQI